MLDLYDMTWHWITYTKGKPLKKTALWVDSYRIILFFLSIKPSNKAMARTITSKLEFLLSTEEVDELADVDSISFVKKSLRVDLLDRKWYTGASNNTKKRIHEVHQTVFFKTFGFYASLRTDSKMMKETNNTPTKKCILFVYC